jgi:hypothetical protein
MDTAIRERPYERAIRNECIKLNRTYANPRWVEGWMRSANSSIDGLSPQEFADNVRLALMCMDQSSDSQNEDIAESVGL